MAIDKLKITSLILLFLLFFFNFAFANDNVVRTKIENYDEIEAKISVNNSINDVILSLLIAIITFLMLPYWLWKIKY